MMKLPATALLATLLLMPGCDRTGPVADPMVGEVVAAAEEREVRIEIRAASTNAESGEPIELMVTLEAPPRERAELVLPADGRLGDFDILRIEDVATPGAGLEVSARRRILVSTLASGAVELPSLEAHYGTDSVLRTEPTAFTIRSLIEGEFDPTAFADIRPAVDDRLGAERPAWLLPAVIIGSGIVVAALAIALVAIARRRTRPRIPHEWALGEFDRIEAEGPPAEEATTDRFQRIETVLRWYVAFRFEIDAPDRTSSELLAEASLHDGIEGDARTLLERLLREGDRAKFAGGRVSVPECTSALGAARRFVELTVPAETEAS